MTNEGFVKFPRIITTRSWFNEPNTLKLYVILRVNAAFKDIERDDYTVHKGEFVTSLSRLSELVGLTVRQTRTALERLQKTNDIAIATNTKFSVIKLNSEFDETQGGTLADALADTRVDKQNDNRSSNEKIERKKRMEKEEAAAASPTASPSSDEITFDCRAELVNKYGAGLVETYEKRFREWAATKRVVNAKLYPTIAKWLAEDTKASAKSTNTPPPAARDSASKGVRAPVARYDDDMGLPRIVINGESSIDTAEIKRRVWEDYRKEIREMKGE